MIWASKAEKNWSHVFHIYLYTEDQTSKKMFLIYFLPIFSLFYIIKFTAVCYFMSFNKFKQLRNHLHNQDIEKLNGFFTFTIAYTYN